MTTVCITFRGLVVAIGCFSHYHILLYNYSYLANKGKDITLSTHNEFTVSLFCFHFRKFYARDVNSLPCFH